MSRFTYEEDCMMRKLANRHDVPVTQVLVDAIHAYYRQSFGDVCPIPEVIREEYYRERAEEEAAKKERRKRKKPEGIVYPLPEQKTK